jgi:hypothetical protein
VATYDFTGLLWRWADERGDGADSWHFVTVPVEVSEQIRETLVEPPRGFGSVRVAVRVGATSWETSVFPDKQSGCYVLPMKRAVRRAEDLEPGDPVAVDLTLRDGP